MSAASQSRAKLNALEGLRGVCACGVVLHHMPFYSHVSDADLVRNAFLFVDLFFVLSGFVMAYNYDGRLTTNGSIYRFVWLRFARLYPLHIAVLAAFFAFECVKLLASGVIDNGGQPPFTGSMSLEALAVNLAMLNGMPFTDTTTWNRPAWSIGAEFYTYILFALLARFAGSWKTAISLALIIGSSVVIATQSKTYMDSAIQFGMLRCISGFLIGVFAANAWRHLQARADAGKTQKREWIWTPIELVAFIAIIAFISIYGAEAQGVTAPYLFAGLVILTAIGKGQVSKLLATPPFVLLGTLSYSIYMLHWFAMQRAANAAAVFESATGVQIVFERDGQPMIGIEKWHGDLYHLAMLLLVIAVSYVAYHIIEAPARDAARRLLTSKSATGANTETGDASLKLRASR